MTFEKSTLFMILNILCVLLTVLQTCSRIRFGVYGELTVFPVDAAVEVGSDVRLNCTTSFSKPVNWQHGKDSESMADVYIGGEGLVRPYSKSSRHSMDEDKNTGRYDLIIKSVTREDAGIYVCSEKASRENPPQARLTVTGTASQEQSCLSYEICKASEEAKLEFSTCTNKPFYMDHVPVGKSHGDDVYNNGKLLNDYGKSGRFRIDDSGCSCVLYIANVTTSDAGTYTCREHSGLGQMHNKDLIVCEEACNKPTDITTSPSETDQKQGSCTVSFVGHRETLTRWIELNCNGSSCSLENVTSEDCQIGRILGPPMESTLSLHCEFPLQTNQDAEQPDPKSDAGTWIIWFTCLVVGVLILLALIVSLCVLKKKKGKLQEQKSTLEMEQTPLKEEQSGEATL